MLIRYFGAAKAASGVEEETVGPGGAGQLPATGVPAGATLEVLLEFLAARHPAASGGAPPLKSVISRSTFLVNGFAARDRSQALAPDATVDILPPFAGG